MRIWPHRKSKSAFRYHDPRAVINYNLEFVWAEFSILGSVVLLKNVNGVENSAQICPVV